MKCGIFFAPTMALTGHLRRQAMHPVQVSVLILKVLRSLHTPAGHFRSKMCASYSSLNNLSVLSTGLGAEWPSPHNEVSLITSLNLSSCMIPLNRLSASYFSPGAGFRVILSSISSILLVPSLQGMHLPQLSR